MNSKNPVVLWSAVALAMSAMCAPATSYAESRSREFGGNATALCQGALPAFETAIRKRPLAVQNEGSSSAFVTCSFVNQIADGTGTTLPTNVQVWFNTSSGAQMLISCTGVSGHQGGANEYIVKAATAPANGTQASITWTASDFAGGNQTFPSSYFSISCNLPPGGAINNMRIRFVEDVGA